MDLTSIQAFLADDLRSVERALAEMSFRDDRVGQSVAHLLSLTGKRLRPVCVAMAARLGTGFDVSARRLAVAVELVHSATLLHDDVVDLGERRRGFPTARLVYGNAASVFAGDWLLVEALRQVRASGVPGLLDELLTVIDKMIVAEAQQLAARGHLDLDADKYFEIIEGKTASLFCWAMNAGARAGGLGESACVRLSNYGRDLGIAFQLIDDTLDLVGDAMATGKALFADVREGKMTHPLIIGAERDPAIKKCLAEVLDVPDGSAVPLDLQRSIQQSLVDTGSVQESRRVAKQYADRARAALKYLPDTPVRAALESVCDTALTRSR